MLDATIVISTYNRLESLKRTLLSLNAQSCGSTFEAVVVDDGSDQDVKGLMDGLSLRFPCAWHWQEHAGFRAAKARNTGILFSSAGLIIFLDDDMIVPKNFVESHITLHEYYRRIVAVGFRHRVPYEHWSSTDPMERNGWSKVAILDPNRTLLNKGAWVTSPWIYFSAANASVRKRDLIEIGLFDEEFVGRGFESTELAYRLHAAGLKFLPLSEPVPHHLESADGDVVTNAAGRCLPPEELQEYRANGRRFSEKYPNDSYLEGLMTDEGMIRALVTGAQLDGSFASSEAENQRKSSLDAVNQDFEEERFKPRILPRWVWVCLLSPAVVLLCLTLILAMVATGRYAKLFRNSRQ